MRSLTRILNMYICVFIIYISLRFDAKEIDSADQIFPYFFMNEMPPGGLGVGLGLGLRLELWLELWLGLRLWLAVT